MDEGRVGGIPGGEEGWDHCWEGGAVSGFDEEERRDGDRGILSNGPS